MCGKYLITPFYPPRRCCEARVGLFKCQGKSKMHLSPPWRCCAARASLLMRGKDLITPFYPPRRCCEIRVGQFKCQEWSTKQFSLVWKSCEAWASLYMWGKDLVTPFYPPGRSCEAIGGTAGGRRGSVRPTKPPGELRGGASGLVARRSTADAMLWSRNLSTRPQLASKVRRSDILCNSR